MMDKTLGYLREALSNYGERELARTIFNKLEHTSQHEKQFIDELSQEEIQYLNDILPKEVDYAKQEKDEKRQEQLTQVLELLY